MQMSQARAEYARWMSTVRDLSPHTVRAYATDLEQLETYLGADATLADLNRDQRSDASF